MSMILAFSKEEADRLCNNSVSPTHILLAMIRHKENSAVKILERLQTNLDELKRALEESTKGNMTHIMQNLNDIDFDVNASRVIRLGVLEARLLKTDTVDAIHVLMHGCYYHGKNGYFLRNPIAICSYRPTKIGNRL